MVLGLLTALVTLLVLNYPFSFTKNYPCSGVWYVSNKIQEIPSDQVSITQYGERTAAEITESIIKTRIRSKLVLIKSRFSSILFRK